MNWKQIVLTIAIYPIALFFSFCLFAITSVKLSQSEMASRFERASSSKADDGLVDYRGQIHVHSYLSHDSKGTIEEIAKAAKAAGVSWVVLTDHVSELPPGLYPNYSDGVIFIYGSESNWQNGGSEFLGSLQNPERQLHLYGHIEEFENWENRKWDSWDAIELVNFHANSIRNSDKLLWKAFWDPKHLYQAITSVLPKNLDYWQSLAEREGKPIPIFAAPDAHQNIGILGVRVDPYNLMLSLVSTHIWLRDWEQLNQHSIFWAIIRGRTYIAFDYLGDPSGFQFWAEYGYEEKFFTGSTVIKPWKLVVNNPWPSGTKVRMIRNNRETYYLSAIENPKPGFWRVEIWRDGNPWIISGQILVK